jgi:hypothetical protein
VPGLDADPGVADAEHRFAAALSPADRHLAPIRRVAHRVADQVGERAAQLLLAGGKPDVAREIERDAVAAGG